MKIFGTKLRRSLVLMMSSSTLFLSFSPAARAIEQNSFLDYSSVIAYAYGKQGTNGQNGADQTILLQNLPVQLNLSGGDGSGGSSGAAGGSASCGSHSGEEDTYNHYDLGSNPYAPSSLPSQSYGLSNSSNGGSGGDGGNGGNGGSLTVFYRQLEDLKLISVISKGGQGGRGGSGGAGGSGCYYCPPDLREPEEEVPDLTKIETKTEVPDFSLAEASSDRVSKAHSKGDSPRCINRPSGVSGSSGRGGDDGEMGHLYLVEQGTELRPDQPTQSVRLSSFGQNRTLSLSKNIWDASQGALTLLAPDSLIADDYYKYSGRLERDYALAWDAPQPVSDFPDDSVRLTLRQTGKIEVVSSEDVWLSSQLSTQANVNRVAIKQVVTRKEASQLTWASLSGQASNLSVSLVDRAGKSDILTTQFRLQYRVARDSKTDRPGERAAAYETHYEGEIPAELVKRDHQRFVIGLGSLPIDPQYLQSGLDVEVELTAVRALSGRSAEQKITWRGKVGS